MNRLPKRCTADYEHRHLVLAGDPPWHMDELDPIAVRMLLHQRAPGLLPLEIAEIDLQVTVKYVTEGRKRLSEQWRSAPMTLSELFRFLRALLLFWEEAENYMLQPGCLLLHEDYIYIGSGMEDAAFVYIPILESSDPEAVPAEQFRAFLYTALAHVDELKGTAVARLLQYVQSGRWQTEELRKLVSEGIAETEGSRVSSYARFDREPAGKANPAPPAWDDRPAASQPERPASAAKPKEDEALRLLWETGSMEEGEEPGTASRWTADPKRLIAAYGVLSAAVWLMWAMSPSERFLYAGAVLQLLLTLGGYMLWQKSRRRPQRPFPEAAPAEPPTPPPPVEERIHPSPDIPPARSPLSLNTAMLPAANRTEILEPGDFPFSPSYPYLLQRNGLREARVELFKTPFVIGRDARSDHRIEEAGVSRRHIEIGLGASGYTVQDLGAANGTRLNGQRLAPYKTYPLADGDEIHIVLSEFVFRLNDSFRRNPVWPPSATASPAERADRPQGSD